MDLNRLRYLAGLSENRGPVEKEQQEKMKGLSRAMKRAKKDYDKDGKVETPAAEYKGSRDKAIKKAKKEQNLSESRTTFGKGSIVRYNGQQYIVNVPNAKADFVGVIPASMRDASESEKDRATDLVRAHKLNLHAEDQEEMLPPPGEAGGEAPGEDSGITVRREDEPEMGTEEDVNGEEELGAEEEPEKGDLKDVAAKLDAIADVIRDYAGEEESVEPESEMGAEEEGPEAAYGEEECEYAMPYESLLKKGSVFEYTFIKSHKTEPKGPMYKSGGKGYGPKPPNTLKTTLIKPGSGGNDKTNPPFDAHKNASWLDKNDVKDALTTIVHKDDSKGYGYDQVKKNAKSGLQKIGHEKKKGTAGGNSLIGEAENATVFDHDYNKDDIEGRLDAAESNKESIHAKDLDDKVNVPANIKRSLTEEINSLRKDAEKVRSRDYLRSEFYQNTADALENLLGHLQEGTKRSIMLAQIDMNRVMSPMQHRIPNDVYLYIVRGGKPASLTELFKEVKVKRDDGADLSKENYVS